MRQIRSFGSVKAISLDRDEVVRRLQEVAAKALEAFPQLLEVLKNGRCLSVHRRLPRVFALSLLLILLALGGRALAAHFLTNLAGLVLLPRWEAVVEALAPTPCPERSEPLAAARWLEAALALAPLHGRAWL